MIAHLVFFKAKPTMKDRLPEVQAALAALPAQIEEIQSYEVGLDESGSERSFDMALYSRFESYESMQVYQAHPQHQAALTLIREVMAEIYAVDYTLPD